MESYTAKWRLIGDGGSRARWWCIDGAGKLKIPECFGVLNTDIPIIIFLSSLRDDVPPRVHGAIYLCLNALIHIHR